MANSAGAASASVAAPASAPAPPVATTATPPSKPKPTANNFLLVSAFSSALLSAWSLLFSVSLKFLSACSAWSLLLSASSARCMALLSASALFLSASALFLSASSAWSLALLSASTLFLSACSAWSLALLSASALFLSASSAWSLALLSASSARSLALFSSSALFHSSLSLLSASTLFLSSSLRLVSTDCWVWRVVSASALELWPWATRCNWLRAGACKSSSKLSMEESILLLQSSAFRKGSFVQGRPSVCSSTLWMAWWILCLVPSLSLLSATTTPPPIFSSQNFDASPCWSLAFWPSRSPSLQNVRTRMVRRQASSPQ